MRFHFVRLALNLALVWALMVTGPLAFAQAGCNSDGQPPPAALHERFLSADCEACWGQRPTQTLLPGTLVLDWIVPSLQGDEAPLSAAASRDALARLEAVDMGRPPPDRTASLDSLVRKRGRTARRTSLRVAMGPALNGHVGVSIAVTSHDGSAAASLWLALVESLPAGSEGSPVPRNLVRNLFIASIDGKSLLSKSKNSPAASQAFRVMAVPEGARAERLRVVGWLQDTQGRIAGIAEAVCTPPGETR